MTAIQIVVAVAVCWTLASVVIGLWLGAVFGLNQYDDEED